MGTKSVLVGRLSGCRGEGLGISWGRIFGFRLGKIWAFVNIRAFAGWIPAFARIRASWGFGGEGFGLRAEDFRCSCGGDMGFREGSVFRKKEFRLLARSSPAGF